MVVLFSVPDVAEVVQAPARPLGQWCLVWMVYVCHQCLEQVVMESHAGCRSPGS